MELNAALHISDLDTRDGSVDPRVATTVSSSYATLVAQSILNDVMKFRRSTGSHTDCPLSPCPCCASPHLAKISAAVEQNLPITFVLPAFPAKSPNPAKVLGPLPDMAERCALDFLQYLCDRIKRQYAPGAEIILCSDGRVFSDVLGIRDQDVTSYQEELSRMIVGQGLSAISTFNLEELYESLDFDLIRMQLMHEYGEPIETIKSSIANGKKTASSADDQEAHRLYCGITRFLFEDALHPEQTKSRTNLQKEARTRAYTVIQRSKAWGELIEQKFPQAVRLSIHPQSCGAKKLGIRLIEPDNWQTPWHGVAVHVEGRYLLLKRLQAEALGAHLVHRFGRPSHYVLTDAVITEAVLTNSKHLEKLSGESNDT